MLRVVLRVVVESLNFFSSPCPKVTWRDCSFERLWVLSWQTSALFVSPARSFQTQAKEACFIFLLNKLVAPFEFSHTGHHIKTCLRALENVPVAPDPLEKHSFGQLQELRPRPFLWSPSIAEGNLPKWPPKRGEKRINGRSISVMKTDSLIRNY